MVLSVTVSVAGAVDKLRRVVGSINEHALLTAIGLRHLKWINDNFKRGGALHPDGPWKPLAPSTVAGRRRSSDRILMDRGTLRNSYVVQVLPGAVEVGTATKYAKWHEEGTRPYTIRPRSRRFMKFVGGGGETRFARVVHHPGLPARPMLPTEKIGGELAVGVIEAEIRRAKAK